MSASLLSPRQHHPSREDWAAARDLPTAVRLLERWDAAERRWCIDDDGTPNVGCMHAFDAALAVARQAALIWWQEERAMQDRVLARLASELPDAADYGITEAVESGDYTGMQP